MLDDTHEVGQDDEEEGEGRVTIGLNHDRDSLGEGGGAAGEYCHSDTKGCRLEIHREGDESRQGGTHEDHEETHGEHLPALECCFEL